MLATSWIQIETKCKERIETGGYDYSTKPLVAGLTRERTPAGSETELYYVISEEEVEVEVEEKEDVDVSNLEGLVPVAMVLELEPTRMMVEDQLQEFLLIQSVTYTLQWADPRLFISPCAGALPSLLSLSFEQVTLLRLT